MKAPEDILFSRHGGRAHVLLNRPQALNAITRDMLLSLEERLEAWQEDDSVAVVTIQGAGGRAFASGGDIRMLYEAGRFKGSRNFPFYADEYRVNARIKRFPKPYVVFMDGITMGGGVGLSVHGSHRVVGDGTLFAMPETAIGLFPDVGGSFFLPRLPGHIGMYLGLTGHRLQAADCIYAGLAETYIPSGETAAAAEALDSVVWNDDRETADAEVRRRLAAFAGHPGRPSLRGARTAIDAVFSAKSLKDLLRILEAGGSKWRTRQAEILGRMSPTSLCVAFRQIRLGDGLSFEACMRMEYRLARAFMDGHDFYEGIRAIIIEKDGKPRWRPATVDEVDDRVILEMFEPLGDDDLPL